MTRSRTDEKRPPQIIPAQPGYAVAVPWHNDSDSIAGIEWELVIAWRIVQCGHNGEWSESPSR